MIGHEPHINALWASLLIEELVRQGVTTFVISPGSRSTPLTVAAARNEFVHCVVHYDERGAAFHALGIARATGRPTACICTSGTAAANYLPAVVEAAQSFVPLVLLTADRPPELLDTGANQAIIQQDLFGEYARWETSLSCPTTEINPEFVLSTAAHAVARTRPPMAGPVHRNCPFREPLAPTPTGELWDAYLSPITRWIQDEARGPYTVYTATKLSIASDEQQRLALRLRGVRRGLIVAGQLADPMEAAAVERLAQAWGWPLLPDITSSLRLRRPHETSLAHYDACLMSARFQGRLAPEVVLHLGGPLVSKRLQLFLDDFAPAMHLRVATHAMRHDPSHRHTQRITANLARFCDWAATAVQSEPDRTWLEPLLRAQASVEATLAQHDTNGAAFDEALLARLVARHIPREHALFLGNSMPIRDMDSYAGTQGAAVRIFANRGASGIDGNVATVAGIARGLGKPVTAVIGDLALLHDLNSLALLRSIDSPVTLVVPNNDGGGIFNFLPIAAHDDVFDPYFATPHGMDFAYAAAQFGIAHHRSENGEDFAEAYRQASTHRRHTLIEIPIQRQANTTAHRALQGAIVDAVEAAL